LNTSYPAIRQALATYLADEVKKCQIQMLAIRCQTAGFKENAILHGVLDRSHRKTAVAFNIQRTDLSKVALRSAHFGT